MSKAAPSRNRRGEGERLRGLLLNAAAELLSEDPDADHLSVRAVTARAGVTHTAMYLHFADKQALIEALKARCFEDLAEVLAGALGVATEDPFAGLCSASEAYLRFAATRPGHYAVMFHGTRAQVGDDNPPEQARLAGMRAFRHLVEATAAMTGEADAHDAATDLWLALHGRAGIRRSMPWFPMRDDATYVADQIDALIRRRAPSPRTT